MAISHVKSNTIANWTGTVTVGNSTGGTQTANATDLVRPADWNSVHNQFYTLTGNTNNASTASGTNVVLSGGNNVTLIGGGATVGISVGNYITTARASNDAVGLNTAQSNVTWTVNSNGLSLDARGYAGTNTTFNGANVSGSMTVNSNGVQISASVAAPVAQTNQTVGGYFVGNTTGQSSSSTFDARTVSFDGAGIVSVGASAGSIRISATQSNQNVTAANGGFAFQTLSFSNANGVSFGTSAGSAITGSVAAQTNQTLGGYALGNTTGQSSSSTFDARTLSIEGAGFISVGWSNGSLRISGTQTNPVVSNAIASVGSATGSGTNTSRFAADDHVHAGVFSVGVSNVGNTAGDTRVDVGRFVFAGGNNITLSQATAANGLNTVSIVGPSGGLTQLSAYAVSNTTQSSSGTIPLSVLSFAGAGIASVGVSNGSIIVSVPAGGGGGDGGVFAGVSTGGNTLGSTGTVSTGNFVLVGSNGITLSQSTGGAGSAATITILGNGRTISNLAIQPLAGMAAGIPFAQSSISLGQNSLYLYPFQLEDHLTVDHVKMPVMITNSSSAAASVQKGYTYRFGIFTRVNETQISQLYSTSYTMAASHSSNASWMLSMITAIGNSTSYSTLSASSAGLNLSASLHGPRELIMPVSTLLSPGDYWVGLVASTSSVGAGGAVLNISNLAVALQTFNRPGLSTATSNRAFYNNLAMGVYSVTTGGMPASINMTQVNLAGTQPILYLGSGTV